jgi:hypothetical protein
VHREIKENLATTIVSSAELTPVSAADRCFEAV